MLKKILGLLAALGVMVYLIFAVVRYSGSLGERRCTGLVIEVADSVAHPYTQPAEVLTLLQLNRIDPVGKPLHRIDYRRMERVVSVLKMVKRVECFSTNSGKVVVRIWQHQPVLRVLQGSDGYYVDDQGERIGVSFNSAADVLVATGSILDSAQVNRLQRFALMVRADTFWQAQLVQVDVEPNGEWVLIPRLGSFEIRLGLPNDVPEKLNNLKLFYQQALPKTGWERYSCISAKYKNQLICTIKE
jgi:cell division protein FtsQ